MNWMTGTVVQHVEINMEDKKMVENGESVVEKFKKDGVKVTGFAVTGAPIWLLEELQKEAKQYYGNVYFPVIVDWYRKAKELENIMRGGLPAPDAWDEAEDLVKEVAKAETKPKGEIERPTLFGK